MKKLLIIGAAVACGAFLPMEAVADTTTAEHSEKPSLYAHYLLHGQWHS